MMQLRNRMFNLALILTVVLSYSCFVSAQTNNCQDSNSYFEVEGQVEKKQCNWVAKNQNRNACNSISVKRFCPKTCQVCQQYACQDVGVPFYIGKEKQKMECSQLNTVTSTKKNFLCKKDKYRMNCRQTCRVCAGSTDPIVRPTPVTPTQPTPTPPSNQVCEDSPSFISVEGQKMQCQEIGKDKNFFCSKNGVRHFCPKTCNACQFGCKDVITPFYIGKNKASQLCYIIRNLTASTRRSKCQLNKYRKNCRETCQVCSRDPGFNEPIPPSTPSNPAPTPSNPAPTPSNPPPTNQYCEDSNSYFDLAPGTRENCNYVANNSRGSCNLDFVKRFCPKTCNACQFGCVDATIRFHIGKYKPAQTCVALNNLPADKKDYKCGLNKYRQNCRRACEVCA